MAARRWLTLFTRWEIWPIIAGNLLPLLGIFYLGWDASTLIILYWLETAVVGFWLVIRLVLMRPGALPPIKSPTGGQPTEQDGLALGLFVILHAAVFMGIHMFMLSGLAPGEWSKHLASPAEFVLGFVIPSGLWLPLLGLFAARGVLTVNEIRANHVAGHLLAGFYARIVLMQFVIIFGGMAALMLGSPAVLLLLIVLFKIIAEACWEIFGPAIEAAFSRTPRN